MPTSQQEQQLLQATTPTLITYPPKFVQGASATVRLRTPQQAMPSTGVAATIDTLSTRVCQAAERGATEIHVHPAVTLVADRRYLIIDDDTGETFVIEAVNGGAGVKDITLKAPLPMAVSNRSQVLGWAVTYALTTTQTQSYGRGVALWEMVASGETLKWAQDLRVTSRQVAAQLTGSDLAQQSPYCLKWQPPDDPTFQRTLAASWNRNVLPVLLAQDIRPELIVSWENLNGWIIAACEFFLADQFDPDAAMVARKEQSLRTAETLVKGGARFWVDDAEDLGSGDTLTEPGETSIKGFQVSYISR